MSTIDLTVDNLAPEEKIRLDQFIVQNVKDFSRSRLKNTCNLLTVNGKPAKFSSKVKLNDVIHIECLEVSSQTINAENIPLDIIYEDENVCVINKKQGMVTHPACGNWSGTLANALLFHLNSENIQFDADSQDYQRNGIVHRLDKDTSGTIITAKNIDAEVYLQKQFKERRVKKEYIAICRGIPKEKSGNVKINIVRDTKNRKKFTTTENSDKGKFSHTVYRVIATYGPYSLVKCTLKTGRTHQIRVHMKYLGCPILGDPIYGVKDKVFYTATLMLHSWRLSIRLPQSEEFTVFKSPTPVRFKKVMKTLHDNYRKVKY